MDCIRAKVGSAYVFRANQDSSVEAGNCVVGRPAEVGIPENSRALSIPLLLLQSPRFDDLATTAHHLLHGLLKYENIYGPRREPEV